MDNRFELNTESLTLRACLVPWDGDAFGFPVAQIQDIHIKGPGGAMQDYGTFQDWLDCQDVRIVSARLPHQRLSESIFLEANSFRFVETVLHPVMENIQGLDIPAEDLLITPATNEDLPLLQDIAENAFGHERYHVDPRLDPRLANIRYGRWVRNSLADARQRLLKVMNGDTLVALFIVETRNDRSAYWHLTAIAPCFQGQGYGSRVWRAMLRHHQKEGSKSLKTTISARNLAVLNLYAKLGFRFLPPEMTFHWVRESA